PADDVVGPDRARRELVAHALARLPRHEDLSRARQALEPRRHVHRLADGGVLHALVAADVADDRLAAVDPDRQLDLAPELLLPLGVADLEPAQDRLGRAHRPTRIVGPLLWRAPDRHRAVAD